MIGKIKKLYQDLYISKLKEEITKRAEEKAKRDSYRLFRSENYSELVLNNYSLDEEHVFQKVCEIIALNSGSVINNKLYSVTFDEFLREELKKLCNKEEIAKIVVDRIFDKVMTTGREF